MASITAKEADRLAALAAKRGITPQTDDDQFWDFLDVETGGELDTTQMDIAFDMVATRLRRQSSLAA